jgi:phosphate:Na+ symporter
MGANLGTTVTAWIIAVFTKVSVSSVAIPIVGIGLPFLFIGKNKSKSYGEVLIGFGLLFLGLGLLKDAVPDVKSLLSPDADPEVKANAEAILTWIKSVSGHGYGSLLIFLALGVGLTLAVQSSSAAMAITVTLALNGWIGFHESAAIVLGENIGTTVTAWLASLGANTNAKRAARAHFLFNVIGVIWMLVVFYPFAEYVEHLGGMLPESVRTGKLHSTPIGFNLAIFHTLFNLLNIILLIGFVPLIANLVTRWVKEPGLSDTPPGRERLTYISQSLVDVGELNLPEAQNATKAMAKLTADMFRGIVEVFNSPDEDLSQKVVGIKRMEQDSDNMMHDITDYLVRCSAAELSEENAASLTAMMRIIAELEEIADCEYRLMKLVERKYNKNHAFAPEVVESLNSFSVSVQEFLDLYNEKLFSTISATDLRAANKLENVIDQLRKSLNKESVKRMREGGNVIEAEMLNIDINNQFEKIGNHALHVLETAQELVG